MRRQQLQMPIGEWHRLPRKILRHVCTGLAVASMVRSLGFVYGFQSPQDVTGMIGAGLMSVITVGGAFFLPQVGAYLWGLKGAKIRAVLSFFLAAVMILFSMLATMSGLYNGRDVSKMEANRIKTEQIQQLQKDASAKEEQLKSLSTQLQQINLDKFDPAKWQYQVALKSKAQLTDQVNNATAELTKTRDRIRELQGQESKRKDFYSFLPFLSADTWELIVVLSGGTIIDVLGPVCLSVAMFL